MRPTYDAAMHVAVIEAMRDALLGAERPGPQPDPAPRVLPDGAPQPEADDRG